MGTTALSWEALKTSREKNKRNIVNKTKMSYNNTRETSERVTIISCVHMLSVSTLRRQPCHWTEKYQFYCRVFKICFFHSDRARVCARTVRHTSHGGDGKSLTAVHRFFSIFFSFRTQFSPLLSVRICIRHTRVYIYVCVRPSSVFLFYLLFFRMYTPRALFNYELYIRPGRILIACTVNPDGPRPFII